MDAILAIPALLRMAHCPPFGCQSRKIDVRELLQYSLRPFLWSSATTEGFSRKTNKAALATPLQKDVRLADGLSQNSAAIIDGTSPVQKLSIGGG